MKIKFLVIFSVVMLFSAVECNVPKVQKNNSIKEDSLGTMVAIMSQVEKQEDIRQPNVDEQIIMPSFESEPTSTTFLSKDIIELAAISNADIKNMSDDELTSLYSQVVDEMTGRNILHAHLHEGKYIAGRDLKPGRYVVSVVEVYNSSIGYYSAFIVDPWSEEKQDWDWIGGSEIDFDLDGVDNKDPSILIGRTGSFSLEEKQRLTISNGEFEIIDYKPFIQ